MATTNWINHAIETGTIKLADGSMQAPEVKSDGKVLEATGSAKGEEFDTFLKMAGGDI